MFMHFVCTIYYKKRSLIMNPVLILAAPFVLYSFIKYRRRQRKLAVIKFISLILAISILLLLIFLMNSMGYFINGVLFPLLILSCSYLCKSLLNGEYDFILNRLKSLKNLIRYFK